MVGDRETPACLAHWSSASTVAAGSLTATTGSSSSRWTIGPVGVDGTLLAFFRPSVHVLRALGACLKPTSINLRMASDLVTLLASAQASIALISSIEGRNATSGVCPVAGRPGFRFCLTFTVDLAMKLLYRKSEPNGRYYYPSGADRRPRNPEEIRIMATDIHGTIAYRRTARRASCAGCHTQASPQRR
jgi:hypothetical protein